MSTPPIALKATGKVADAALCMTEVRCSRLLPCIQRAGNGATWHSMLCGHPCQLRAPPCHFLPVRLPPSPEHKFRRMPLTQPLLSCPVAVPTATYHAPCLPPLPRSTSSTAFPWWMTTACAWAL